jgi:hypothetical protein
MLYTVYILFLSLSSCYIMAIKMTPLKSLSKWYTLASFCLCLYVSVRFVCPFAFAYIKIGLCTVELTKIELLLSLLLLL